MAHFRSVAVALCCMSLFGALLQLRASGAAAAAELCTASGLATGIDSCLASLPDKDDCCDYLINDIVVPCGITEVCGLELGSSVLEFFSYCRFKCRGLAAPTLTSDL